MLKQSEYDPQLSLPHFLTTMRTRNKLHYQPQYTHKHTTTHLNPFYMKEKVNYFLHVAFIFLSVWKRKNQAFPRVPLNHEITFSQTSQKVCSNFKHTKVNWKFSYTRLPNCNKDMWSQGNGTRPWSGSVHRSGLVSLIYSTAVNYA